MNSYELRPNRRQPWRQCDRDEALAALASYGNEAEKVLKRIDAGETVNSATVQIRKFKDAILRASIV